MFVRHALLLSVAALVWGFDVKVAVGQSVDRAPKLIVMVAVDQLRRDRLDSDLPGGIGRILTGRNFVEGSLDHGITNTCPGHVVMLTGANPDKAGVPGNSFIDRETFVSRYCVDDANDQYRVIGGAENRSPKNIRVSALGDWLKAQNSNSRVFSVAGKDRAAIALGGQRPDGVYWYHRDTGTFTSSGYYTEALPEFVREFNGSTPEVDGFMSTLPDVWVHGASAFRPDEYEGEKQEYLGVSGHPVLTGEDIYEQVYRSPYLDKMTLEVASRLVKSEQLGQRGVTDLLSIALSATDTIGHSYGPRSGEAEDALTQLDLWLGQLLDELEASVGKDDILVVLSADHGVAELPEYQTQQGTNACPEQGRIAVNSFVMALYWNIYKEFSFPFNMPNKLVMFGGSAFTINQVERERVGIDEAELLAWLERYLTNLDIVERTWSREQIQQGRSEHARLLRNSFVPDRSGDLFVQLKEDCLLYPDGGTTHGSLYDYDREVPVVFYGKGVRSGEVTGPAYSVDIAPTLAKHIGVSVPADLNGRALPLN